MRGRILRGPSASSSTIIDMNIFKQQETITLSLRRNFNLFKPLQREFQPILLSEHGRLHCGLSESSRHRWEGIKTSSKTGWVQVLYLNTTLSNIGGEGIEVSADFEKPYRVIKKITPQVPQWHREEAHKVYLEKPSSDIHVQLNHYLASLHASWRSRVFIGNKN